MHFSELQIALRNTLLIGGGVVAIAVPLATLLSILLVRTNVHGARWAWLALSSQLAVPLYVFAGGWSAGFGTLGWWPIAPAKLIPLEWTSIGAVLFIHAVAVIPWLTLIIAMGLVWTQRSLEEAAFVEGGWPQVLRLVTLPRLRPWIGLACIWGFVPLLTEMVVTNLYQVPTLPEQVYLDISLLGTSSWTYAASLGLCIVPLLVGGIVAHRLLSPWSELVLRCANARQPIYALRSLRLPVSACVWLVVVCLVALPLANLVLKAGWQTVNKSPLETTHHWSAYRFMLTLHETSTLFTQEAYWSFMLASCSATGAILAAICLCTIGRTPSLRAWIALGCLVLLAVPGPIAAQSVIFLFTYRGIPGLAWMYDHTLAAPILAQQFRMLPLAYWLCKTILASIDTQCWDVAALDGLQWSERLRCIILPHTGANWVAAWFLLAAFSFGELSTNLLVLPPGVATVAQRLFEFLHFGMRYQDSGLCLALMAIGWIVAGILWKTRKGFQ